MAGKRGAGEGSIRQRANGRWEARITVGTRPDGRPDVRSLYGATRAEAQRKLSELRRRAESGTVAGAKAERQTLGTYLDGWAAATAATTRPSTHQRYVQIIRLHLAPALGRRPLAALQPDEVQRLYAAKLAAGQAPRTVRKLHCVLHKALRDAVRWGKVGRNVCDVVTPPAVSRKELRPPSPSDLGRLLTAAEAASDHLRALWTVAIYSGCRQGELLGLTWADLDLDAGTLAVRRTLQSVKAGVPTFGEPKTARGRRTVTIPAPAIEAFRGQRQRQLAERLKLGPDYAGYDLIFATRLGTPHGARNVTREFKEALARAGLPASVRFHDLRHAAATMLLQAGVHPKVVSERLGHSSVTLTLDTYSHVVPSLDADAAARLAAVMQAGPQS